MVSSSFSGLRSAFDASPRASRSGPCGSIMFYNNDMPPGTECVSPHAPPDPRKLPVPVGKALNQGAGAINKKQTRIPSQGLFARQPGVQVLAELLE